METVSAYPVLKNQELFDKYCLAYEELPIYKKLLRGLIKYSEMYRPIPRGDRNFDPWGHLAGINEERQVKRAEFYLREKDLIQTFDEKSGKRLVVTSRGHKIFYEDYPLAELRRKPWDKMWTLVMYDFPERERTNRKIIRRRLIDLGFGCPQISLLVSPLPLDKPVQQLLEGEGLAEKVWTLRAERVLGMENWQVVQRAWPQLAEISALYEELLEVAPRVEREVKKLFDWWGGYFLAVNNADPYLPFELLPTDWQGSACEKEYFRLNTKRSWASLIQELPATLRKRYPNGL